MDVLNNRELATIFWMFVFFFWVYLKSKDNDIIQTSIKGFFSAVYNKSILIALGLMLIYASLVSIMLAKLDVWDSGQFKNLFIWIVTVALVNFFNANKIKQDKNYFKNTLLANFKIVVLIQFLVNTYTFDFIVELIIIPVFTLIFMMIEFSKTNGKYHKIKVLLSRFIELSGAIIIVFAIYSLIDNPDEVISKKGFNNLVVPVILSIAILPYMYLLTVYIRYEGVRNKVRVAIPNKALRLYALTIFQLFFRGSISTAEWWADTLFTKDLTSINDVNDSIHLIRKMKRLQEKPPTIPSKNGWSPYLANTFLEEFNLNTKHYKNLYDNEWYAQSNYMTISALPKKSIGGNDVHYSISGTFYEVKKLTLSLNINRPSSEKSAVDEFLKIGKSLYLKSLHKPMPVEVEHALKNREKFTIKSQGKAVNVQTESWGDSCSQLKLCIEV